MPIYQIHEPIQGILQLKAAPNFEHQGINVELVGMLTVQDPIRGQGLLIESKFYHCQQELVGPQQQVDGKVSISFCFPDGIPGGSYPSIESPLGVKVRYFIKVFIPICL